MKKLLNVMAVVSGLVLAACGGGSSSGGSNSSELTVRQYEGSTSSATVTDNNAEALGKAAVVGTSRVIGSDDVVLPIGVQVESEGFASVVEKLIHSVSSREAIPSGVKVEDSCFVSGSRVTNLVGVDEDAQSIPSSGRVEVEFNNCNDGDGAVIDGVAIMIYSGGLDDILGPRNYTLSMDVEYRSGADVFELVGESSCTNYGEMCSFAEMFVEDGVTYRVQDVEFEQDGSIFSVQARVYDENEGYISFVATGITLDGNGNGNGNGNVCSGSISVTDSTSSEVMTVDFPNCSEFIVTYNGSSVTYDQ